MAAGYFIGVDLHLDVIQVCVLDLEGEVVHEERFRGRSLEEGLRAVRFIRKHKKARVAVEALGMNRWFVDALRPTNDVVVVDAGKLNLKSLGKKTDRRDAYEIARRLRLGDIDKNAKTYYPTDEEYGLRKILRTRNGFTKMKQQVVNQIRALLRNFRIPQPENALTTKNGLKALRELSGLSDFLGVCLRELVDQLEQLHRASERMRKRIEEEAERPAVAALADHVPQIGPQTALTLVAELGDVSRFKGTRAVASYAGLVPRVANSADKTHHGQITKRGNSQLRWLLVEWAVRLMSFNNVAKKCAAPRLKRSHKNKVRTALARRLLVGVYITLRRGEVFSLERCLAA